MLRRAPLEQRTWEGLRRSGQQVSRRQPLEARVVAPRDVQQVRVSLVPDVLEVFCARIDGLLRLSVLGAGGQEAKFLTAWWIAMTVESRVCRLVPSDWRGLRSEQRLQLGGVSVPCNRLSPSHPASRRSVRATQGYHYTLPAQMECRHSHWRRERRERIRPFRGSDTARRFARTMTISTFFSDVLTAGSRSLNATSVIFSGYSTAPA